MDRDDKADVTHEVGGKVKEAAGWAAGDREVEAEGKVEQGGETPAPDEVEGQKQQVRREHGDID